MRKVFLLLLAFSLVLIPARMARAEGQAGVQEGGAAQQPVLVGRWLGRGPYPGYAWLAFSLPRPTCRADAQVYAVEVVSQQGRTAALAYPARNTLLRCGQGVAHVAVLVRPEDAPFVAWVERAFDGQAVQVWTLRTPAQENVSGNFWRNCATWTYRGRWRNWAKNMIN